MASYIKSLTFDCADVRRTAGFWAAALGSDVDDLVVLADPEGNEFCVE